MMLELKRLIVTSCVFFLVACGGGSGGTSDTPSTTPSPVIPSSSTSPASSSVASSIAASNSSSLSSSTITAPQNLNAQAGNNSVTLSWNAVAGATSYHVYYATEPNIISKNISAFQNGIRLQNVSTPYTISGLQNNQTYYFVVTAIKGTEESAQSLETNATPSDADISRQPTAQEVLVMELINRARFDPSAEATRYGIGLNDGITGTQITADRKQPLAMNLFLTASARAHSQWMLDNDMFSHTGVNNSTPTDRMTAAGYVFAGSWNSGENIAWAGTTAPSINLTEYAQVHHEGLFKSPGHRVNILGTSFREIGIGQKRGNFLSNGTNYLSSMLTENFARSGNNFYLTGVVYNDTNSNQFYDVGEGMENVTISTNGKSYPVYSTGAYSIPLTNGTYDVVITGTPLGSTLNYRVQINNANFKLDVVRTGSTSKVVTW